MTVYRQYWDRIHSVSMNHSPVSEFDLESVVESSGSGTDILRQFIEQYEALPVLWNPTHKGYCNKHHRNIALDKLKVIYEQLKPGCKREDVKRKLNTLRSNYRKELNKITISKRSGCSTDDVYIPKSWVFYALQFLYTDEKPANEQTNEAVLVSEDVQQDTIAPVTPFQSTIDPQSQPPFKKPKLSQHNDSIEKACLLAEQPLALDKMPTIAKAWGEILLTLDPLQRVLAEKGVSDILFEARLGTLHRHSIKVNEAPWPPPMRPPAYTNLASPTCVSIDSDLSMSSVCSNDSE